MTVLIAIYNTHQYLQKVVYLWLKGRKHHDSPVGVNLTDDWMASCVDKQNKHEHVMTDNVAHIYKTHLRYGSLLYSLP